jgi:hypothetical protein
MELVHLLDFGINSTTVTVLQGLIAQRLVYDENKPPVEEKERQKAIDDMRWWLQQVFSVCGSAAYGGEIDRNIREAAHEGATLVRQMSPAERPQSVDPIAFHDFFVVAHQCERTTQYLEYVIRELRGGSRISLDNFRRFKTSREKRS